MNHRGTEHTEVAQRRPCMPTFRAKPVKPVIVEFNSGARACRCVCVDQWQCPGLLCEKRNKESRSFAESSTAPGLLHRQDEAVCPSRYDDPTAIARELLPVQTLRSAVAF